MKPIIKFLSLSIIFSSSMGSYLTADPASHHVAVSLHEDMINNFFTSIGEISGKGSKKVFGKKVKYTWTVKDPYVDIEPGTASFKAKVEIKAGAFKSIKEANGKMEITYLPESNRIKIKVKETKVKLSFKFLGQKVPIGSINLAKYYKPSFEFAGPQPIQNQIEVELPDDSKRVINIITRHGDLVLGKDNVTVFSNLEFNSGL
ncbi:MAG: hypothetical protein ACE5EE_05095 [Fidelibacterota bacterium]